jgi:hypothetical protein
MVRDALNGDARASTLLERMTTRLIGDPADVQEMPLNEEERAALALYEERLQQASMRDPGAPSNSDSEDESEG